MMKYGLAVLLAVTTCAARAGDISHRAQALALVKEIQRADYAGDRPALRSLHDKLARFAADKELAAKVLYWEGFALWRRALNGFNESADQEDLEKDLRSAIKDFESALVREPGFADAKIAEASCMFNLIFLHRKDSQVVKELLQKALPMLQQAQAEDSANPRLAWVVGANRWYNPPERGGGQDLAIDTYQKGLQAARSHKSEGADPLAPSWGEPELLLNLAWSSLHRNAPDLAAAEQYARSALALVPYWHYVRDILLPQILAARKQEPSDLAHAEWVTTGGHGWDRIAGVVLDGTRVEGGVPSKFVKTLDLRTGHSRMTQQAGPTRAVSGFDGVNWNAFNGIVNSIDLPPLVEDARSRAFVDRAGWRAKTGYTISKVERSDRVDVVYYRPDGGSEIGVSFELEDHTVKQVVFQTDDGPLTLAYSDWRRIGKVSLPFRQMETSNTGEVTTLEIKRVRLLNRISPEMLARPAGSRHGRLASGEEARIPFRYLGSHILVSTAVNGVPADVVFDTGAANYFSPAWAQRFGLKVSGGLNLGGVGESSTTGGYALVKKMSLGSAELADETVIIGPTPFAGNATPAGSVGFELLAEFLTTIDYPAQTITFAESHQHAAPLGEGTTVPMYTDGHSIFIASEVDGRRGLFRLDTGDGGTVTLFPTFAQEHDLYQTTVQAVVSGAGVGGTVTARNITLSHFKLGGTEFREIPARLSLNRAGSFASRSLAGNLGGGLLRCFRITVDYPGRRIAFQSDPERLRNCVTPTHK